MIGSRNINNLLMPIKDWCSSVTIDRELTLGTEHRQLQMLVRTVSRLQRRELRQQRSNTAHLRHSNRGTLCKRGSVECSCTFQP